MPRFLNKVTYKFKLAELARQDTIYMHRPGGLGDVILIAMLAELLSQQTNFDIRMVTKPAYHNLLKYFVGLAECVTKYKEQKNNPFYCDLHALADEGLRPRSETRWDIFSDKIGISFEPDKVRLKLFLTESTKPFIGVVLYASTANRTWKRMLDLAEKLTKFYPVAIISDKDASLPCRHLDLTGLPLEVVAAEINNNCKLLITPDTGILHLAMLLGVPSVAIFGPIEPKLRIWRPELVDVIQADLDCVPCHEFSLHNCPLGEYLQCLKIISVEEVYERVIKVIKKREIKFV